MADHGITPDFDADNQFARIFTAAVGRRGLTLERLSTRLRMAGTPLSVATLSYWQSGRSVPARATSLRALPELETLLQLPPGTLTAALPTGAVPEWWVPPHVEAPDVKQHLVAMGLDLERRADRISVHDHFEIRDRHTVMDHRIEMVLRSEVDGWLGLPVVYRDTSGTEAPELVSGAGVELVQQRRIAEQALCVGELRVPYQVSAGDLLPISFEVRWGDASLPDVMRHMASSVRCYVFSARFHGRLPHALNHTHEPNELDLPMEEHQLPVRGDFVHHVMLNAPIGTHSYDWSH